MRRRGGELAEPREQLLNARAGVVSRGVAIVESDQTVLGRMHQEDAGFFDGGAFEAPVSVGDPGAKNAQPDDKVVIEMVRFPSTYRPGEAVFSTTCYTSNNSSGFYWPCVGPILAVK